MKYFVYHGMDKVEIEGDSVGLTLPDGKTFELTLKRDGEVEIRTTTGSLILIPRASNVVEIDCEGF